MPHEHSGPGSGHNDGTATDVAKHQAGRVGQTAAEAGGQVTQTAKEQARNVAGEARQQARDLIGEARMQVQDQAGSQKSRAVHGLRALGDELDRMAQQGGQSGLATEVARQVSGRTRDLAQYLDRHEPSDLLDEVRAYARRRPVIFLTGAALAGAVAGRLTRGLAAGGGDSGTRRSDPTGHSATPLPETTTYPDGGQIGQPYPAVHEPGRGFDPALDPDRPLARG